MNARRTIAMPIIATAAALLMGPALPGQAADTDTTPTLEIVNAHVPTAGVVTAGQPTRAQLEAAAQAGFETVVNLRAPGEQGSIGNEAQVVEGLGMRYVAIPIAGAQDISRANACRLAEVLAEAEARPALVHCASSNRVGALFALNAFHLEAKSSSEALAAGRSAGLTSLATMVQKTLEGGTAIACAAPTEPR